MRRFQWLCAVLCSATHADFLPDSSVSSSSARQLLIHREEPKRQNPNGPCSTMVNAGPAMTVEELQDVVSARLGFSVAALVLEGKEVRSLEQLKSGTLISAMEELQIESAPQELSDVNGVGASGNEVGASGKANRRSVQIDSSRDTTSQHDKHFAGACSGICDRAEVQ
eukprot:TRINITY_DN34001_c0_g1_i1.p2 TRINITY_DN34001_c0_g1~~TRINITY_DN34001_c0_g1_i1.p2  ORF type:complete len:168 (-),score=39.05 TRINITY_DN34001_c0_g1_i1:12-515(-)